MSNQITVAQIQQYKNNVALLLQERGPKLRVGCMTDTYTGKAGKAVEQIGAVTAQKRTGRHTDTPLIETPHDARWVYPEDYEWADLIDDVDKLRHIVDFESPYAVNGALSIARAQDDAIITALLGTSKTGENGSTNTAFDTSNQQIAASSTGMTVAKLRTAKKKLLANHVDVDSDPLFVAMSAEQMDDMLSETQAISLDYNTRPVLVDGKITSFMGFNFIHTERLSVSGTERSCIAWAKSGAHFGVWKDIDVRMSERDDKSYSTQVFASSTFGATRLEEGKVVEILCDEA